MIDLAKLIEQANDLPPLQASTVRLAELASNPDCQLADVAELVSFDQILTVKLLRAANSAASAGAVPVGTVREAVARMGTAHVLALAVAAGARPFLQAGVPAYGLNEGALWRHSVAAAVAAEIAPRFCRVPVPPETFTTALLHDIGKLVMGRFLSPEILAFIERAKENDHLSQLEAETSLLQVHHGELGGLIAQHWKLPPRIVLGITYHDVPDEGSDVICDLSYLTNQVAKRVEAEIDARAFVLNVDAGVVERLGLTPQALEGFCSLAAARYEQVSRRYNAV